MSTGAWILVATVVVALAFGAYRAAVDGRFRGTRELRGAAPAGSVVPSSVTARMTEQTARTVFVLMIRVPLRVCESFG